MDIVLCGKCGWLGSEAEVATKKKVAESKSVQSIVLSNGLSCKCCPKCESTGLYSKPLAAPYQFIDQSPRGRDPGSEIMLDPLPRRKPQVTERPAYIPPPVYGEVDVKISDDEEEELPDLSGDDIELTAEIVSGVLVEAAAIGQKKEDVAKDLADGMSVKNKKLIANLAGVEVDSLTDSPKKAKVTKTAPPKPRTAGTAWKCDICGDEFVAKVQSSRCKKCMDQYMALMVGS